MRVLNFDLMKSPLNWLIVLLMVFIGAIALDEIFRFAGVGTSANDCGCHKSLFPIPASSSTSE